MHLDMASQLGEGGGEGSGAAGNSGYRSYLLNRAYPNYLLIFLDLKYRKYQPRHYEP